MNQHSEPTGEFARIARFFAPLAAGLPGALGLRDDAAVLTPPPGRELVITTDTVVAGVHFLGDETPRDVAKKLLRVNLSDLASMGATPFAYTLNVAFPPSIDDPWVADFAAGLAADQSCFGIHLAGGDSVSTPGPLTLTLTALGTVQAGGALQRSAARPGDEIFVSGTIGDGALGLAVAKGGLPGLSEGDRNYLLGRYRRPQPRLTLGQGLVGLAHGAVDVSDGLIADIGHVAEVSGVAAIVDAASVPRSPAAERALRDEPALLETLLTGGDDYELAFTAPAAAAGAVAGLSASLGLAVTRIGWIEVGAGVTVRDAAGKAMALSTSGYVHR